MAHDFVKFPELRNSQIEEMQFESPHQQITEDFAAVCVRVHDGDTITLKTNFRDFDFPLRFLDIDAPEMNAGGEVARDWLRGRILNEKVEIKINKANRVDKYGRLLGKVLHGGMNVGDEELRNGLATSFSKRREDQLPNIDKELSIKQWF